MSRLGRLSQSTAWRLPSTSGIATRPARAICMAGTRLPRSASVAVGRLRTACAAKSLCNDLGPVFLHAAGQPSRALATSSSSSSSPGILIWADHDGQSLHSSTYNILTAAKRISDSLPITVLITGSGVGAVAKQAAALPVSAVLVCDDPLFEHQLPEPVSALIVDVLKSKGFSYLLVPTTSNGKNVLPRVAVGVDSQPVTEVVEVLSGDTFVRPIYAGNALCTVQLLEPLKLLSVRPTSFDKTQPAAAGEAVKPVPHKPSKPLPSPSPPLSTFVREELTKSERPDLSTARVVISGGRGLKSAANFALLTELADLLHGAVGASRAAVDAGMVSNDHQVGQTGKVVAPDLYVAVGISGAIQHLAGMKDSKVIVAINKDSEAPIFQVADYAIVGDLFTIVPELTSKLKASKD